MSDATSTPKVHEIFYREIDREINEVVKVDNDDPAVVKQELTEYILTPQLERHFSEAVEAVSDTEHSQTEDVGMWISGFFGSGKSHFMKILGYVLENREFDEQNAADIFKGRSEDEMLNGTVDGVNSKFDSEVLMFQIGAKADASGTESITEIIHREFNTSRGYASMPWVARMEQELESRGIYEEFVDAIEAETGKDWTEARKDAMFVRSDMETALVQVSEDFKDEAEARRAIEDVEENVVITASSLTDQILEHVEQREAETGENCRYFVFIDEISQFIGDDGQRLLELQSLVEEFGQKGKGKLFLGVTSQEQLQELIPGVLEQEAEESKVIDRFPHRFDLVSDNLDKVVRDRILSKKGAHTETLGELYEDNEGMLSARYKLDSSRNLKSINRSNFVDCYPFLPYQLDILPAIFASLRGRGSDDRLTGRERTLIDVTQSVLKDRDLLYNEDLGALVTMDMIFDEISAEIPDSDVSSIQNADPEDADSALARRVLKSLYLIQQLDWIPNSAENIATTLQSEIGSTHEMESAVEEVLTALVDAGYVGRSEEGYRFLRETERELENEIKGVKVRTGDIRRASKRFLDDVIDGATRVNYEGQSFDLSVTVDGEQLSSSGDIELTAYSPVYQLYEDVDKRRLKTQSHKEEDSIYWIADPENADAIRDKLKSIQQIDTVLKQKRGENLSQEEQEAVGQKQEDLQRLRNEVGDALTKSFQKGTLIYHGTMSELDETSTSLGSLVEREAKEAVPRVYTKLEHGLATVKDRHISAVFGDLEDSSLPGVLTDLGVVNDGDLVAEARIASEVEDEIRRREKAGEDRSGGDLIAHFSDPPYGWSRDVVRLAAAVLFRNGSIVPTFKERTYGNYTEDGAQELFTQVSKFQSVSFDERETVDPPTRTDAKQLLDRLFDRKVKSTDQAVDEGIREEANDWVSTTSTLLPQLERVNFPHVDEVRQFKQRLENLQKQATSAKRIKQFVEFEEELEGLTKVVKSVTEFCQSGQDHLEEYETIQRFVTTEWDTLTDAADSHPELVAIDDDAREAAQRVRDTLDTDGVIDKWTDVTTDYGTAVRAYASTYESLYERRHEVYSEAIQEARDYAGEGIDDEDLETALAELGNLQGGSSVDLDVSANDHINPSPSITRLIEHIKTVDAYLSDAKTEIDELGSGTEVTRERVDLTSIFGGTVVTEPDELDAPIEELRSEVEALLEEDEDVEVRFS
jgi:hypothetical protein